MYTIQLIVVTIKSNVQNCRATTDPLVFYNNVYCCSNTAFLRISVRTQYCLLLKNKIHRNLMVVYGDLIGHFHQGSSVAGPGVILIANQAAAQ